MRKCDGLSDRIDCPRPTPINKATCMTEAEWTTEGARRTHFLAQAPAASERTGSVSGKGRCSADTIAGVATLPMRDSMPRFGEGRMAAGSGFFIDSVNLLRITSQPAPRPR
jgi:hypothetical protein